MGQLVTPRHCRLAAVIFALMLALVCQATAQEETISFSVELSAVEELVQTRSPALLTSGNLPGEEWLDRIVEEWETLAFPVPAQTTEPTVARVQCVIRDGALTYHLRYTVEDVLYRFILPAAPIASEADPVRSVTLDGREAALYPGDDGSTLAGVFPGNPSVRVNLYTTDLPENPLSPFVWSGLTGEPPLTEEPQSAPETGSVPTTPDSGCGSTMLGGFVPMLLLLLLPMLAGRAKKSAICLLLVCLLPLRAFADESDELISVDIGYLPMMCAILDAGDTPQTEGGSPLYHTRSALVDFAQTVRTQMLPVPKEGASFSTAAIAAVAVRGEVKGYKLRYNTPEARIQFDFGDILPEQTEQSGEPTLTAQVGGIPVDLYPTLDGDWLEGWLTIAGTRVLYTVDPVDVQAESLALFTLGLLVPPTDSAQTSGDGETAPVPVQPSPSSGGCASTLPPPLLPMGALALLAARRKRI